MEKAENKEIIAALLKAQMGMGNAKKGSTNPFFKQKYADLNSVREACLPELNKNGIVVLQPIVQIEGKNYVKTLLLHESGESMECNVEILYSKQNDAQAQGSGITYARRYGLQSIINIGAEDDDGNGASQTDSPKKTDPAKKPEPVKVPPQKKTLTTEMPEYMKAKEYILTGGTIEEIQKKYILTEDIIKLLKQS